ncbi:hypothetical protein AGMMS4956_02890 [Bacteroidia bacterium]|nr:hypothetical protein AGMMS4956_02890 [Bacteroidia bacterium]
MKANFKKLLLPLVAVVLVSANGWGATETITITVSSINDNGATLGTSAYNGGAERAWTQNGVSFGGKAITQAPSPNTGAIMAQASNGVIYNTTALPGRIIDIVITNNGTNTNTSLCYGGSTERLVNDIIADYTRGGTQVGSASAIGWTSINFTETAYTYFVIKRSSTGAAYWTSIAITYETSEEPENPDPPTPGAPSATPSTTSLEFGNVIQGQSSTLEFTITPQNLTSDLTISASTAGDGDVFSVDVTNIPQATTGTQTITVTFTPAVETAYTGRIIISGDGVADTVALIGTGISASVPVPALYGLVTKASQLVAGAKYLIVSKNGENYYALGYQGSNIRPGVMVTIDGTTLSTRVAEVATEQTLPYELTLGGDTDLWTLEDAVNGKKIGPFKGSGDNSYLRLSNNTPTFTIAIAADGKATITCVGEESNTHTSPKNFIRFNYNGGNTRFACYASGQTDVYLYKLGLVTAATPTADLAAGNYEGAQNVTLATTTEGATIYYTTDNWTTSNTYSAPINIATATTLKAYAAAAGMENSDTLTVDYTFLAAVTVAPLSHNFGVATLGGDAKTFTITLSKAVNLTGDLTAAIAPDTAHGVFTILSSTLTQAVVEAGNGEVQVTFSPTHAGNYGDTLVISGGGITPVKVRLSGSGSAPYLKFNAGNRSIYNVGSVAINFSAYVLEDVIITTSNPAFVINKSSTDKSKTRDTITVSISAATTDSALIRIVSGTLSDSVWIKPAIAPVGWAFTTAGTDSTATTGLNGNSGNATISANTAAKLTYNNDGVRTSAWVTGKYWETSAIDVRGYANLKLQYSTQGSGTGPKNWKVQYKIGTSVQWQDFGEISITTANTAHIYSFDLPAACNGASELYLRWIVKDEVSINGNSIGTTGSNYLQDIYLTAVSEESAPPSPTGVGAAAAETLQVYPNPTTNGELRIESGELNAWDKVEIYNINGALVGAYRIRPDGEMRVSQKGVSGVFNTPLQGNIITINIAHLPAGIYLVKVGNRVAKVVKQ